MSTKAKLNKLLQTKKDIKRALEDKGVKVGDVFAEYPDAIKDLSTTKINVADAGIKFAYSTFEEIPSIYDFSDVTDASQMFNSTKLKTTKGINLENVIDFTSTFYNCYELEDISDFKVTNSADDLYRMLEGCRSIRTIDFSNWDTSNVGDMDHTFNGCSGLTEIDITPLDLSKV